MRRSVFGVGGQVARMAGLLVGLGEGVTASTVKSPQSSSSSSSSSPSSSSSSSSFFSSSSSSVEGEGAAAADVVEWVGAPANLSAFHPSVNALAHLPEKAVLVSAETHLCLTLHS